jgi:hypothetical protein
MKLGRVKVLNYLNRFYNINEGSSRGVLWPVAVFSISLPVKKNKPLNIFEETILLLTNQNIKDIKRLSEEVCMDEEIIKFILNKLVELNLIDHEFEVTENGKDIILQWETEETEFASANVFFDLIGQQLIPTVIYDNLEFERVVEKNGKSIKFVDSRFERNRSTSFGRILGTNYFNGIDPPTSKDVNKIINIHRKLHFKYVHVSEKDTRYIPNYYAEGGAVRVNPNPNYYHIYCKVIFQKGSNDFIITDPFGYGFSSLLKKSYREYLIDDEYETSKMIEKQKDAIEKRLGKSKTNKTMTILPMVSDKINEYPQVKECLISVEANWKKAKIKPRNSVEEDKQKMYLDYVLTDLYKSLEWTLKHVVNENPVDKWVDILIKQNYKCNSDLISKMAKNIGFTVPEGFSLLEVAPGKFKAVSVGAVELQPLLSLSILGASNDNMHPLHSLAIKIKDWLNIINQLKKFRDAEQHGDTQKNKIKVKEAEHFINKIYETIRTLLPKTAIKVKVRGKEVDDEDIETIGDQKREKVFIHLQEEFGYNELKILDKDIAELLVRIELFALENKSTQEKQIECSNAITNLASLLQNTVFSILKTIFMKNDIINDRDEIIVFQKKVEQYFRLSKDQFPESLINVNPNRIKEASNGLSSTLGAGLIALINICNDRIVEKLGLIKPNLIEVVGDILEKRGHGNEPVFKEFKELIELKNKVYKIFKQLQDIEND